jgi:hypothetical protein
MDLEEVLSYLRNVEDFQLGPMDAIRAQTEAIGDPSLPTPPQVAILEWLQQSCELLTTNFPIEEPLAATLRKLFPVAAALAITDAHFFLAGAHPLHKLLDTIQASAIGWQPQLGRAGMGLERLVDKAVSDIQAWFSGEGGELADICAEAVTAATKDLDRARRMTQRLADTEKGRLRTASARWKAAEMINSSLATHKATVEIGEFLQGAWYESAQLVLLKFGADSTEWAQMSEATDSLLDSLQIDEAANESRRQHLFEVVTKTPKDVKRWLLSLHMDTEAINDAIGVIEFAHLQLLRQQPIELQTIAPLHMEGMATERTTGSDLETIQSLELGQWFAVDEGNGEHQRVQLFLKLSQEQQLQFANKAGRKVLQLSYENFCKLLANGKARILHNGASFSRCLAVAAGIESTEDLEALIALEAPQRARLEQAKAERAERERLEAERTQRGQEETEHLEREQLEAEQARLQHEEAERILLERQETARVEREQQEADRTRHEQQEAERVLLEQQRAERIKRQQKAEQILREQQEAEKVQHEHSESERDQRARLEAERIQREQRMAAQQASGHQATANHRQTEAVESPGNLNPEEDEINLSMGTWLGFHDGDTPLMAKLAVHDTEQDSFIFVNREGIKIRSLNKRELFSLINNNLVEILEARSNFREQVTRARKDLGQ